MIKQGEESSPTTCPLGVQLGCWCLRAAAMSSESKPLPEGQLGENELSTWPEGDDIWGLTNWTSQEVTILTYAISRCTTTSCFPVFSEEIKETE